jgi:hypothetical protein
MLWNSPSLKSGSRVAQPAVRLAGEEREPALRGLGIALLSFRVARSQRRGEAVELGVAARGAALVGLERLADVRERPIDVGSIAGIAPNTLW